MDKIWDRIEVWLAANAPVTAAGFNPPATEAEITETERFVGVRFPDDVRASYLRHNGEDPTRSPGMLEGWEWLSLTRMRQDWSVWKELLNSGDLEGSRSDGDGASVRDDWWNPAWIPLVSYGNGDSQCLDLAPGPEGRSGQIIEINHDHGLRPIVAHSFHGLLADFADGLESGTFVVSEKYGHIMRRGDAEI